MTLNILLAKPVGENTRRLRLIVLKTQVVNYYHANMATVEGTAT